MNVLQSIFLGAVQGVTEFLPISSSGHLKIMEALSKKLSEKMIKFHFVNEDYDGDHYVLYKNGKIVAEKDVVDKNYWD